MDAPKADLIEDFRARSWAWFFCKDQLLRASGIHSCLPLDLFVRSQGEDKHSEAAGSPQLNVA
jgi:hypothetical protein